MAEDLAHDEVVDNATAMLWEVLRLLGTVSEKNLAKRPESATFSCQVHRDQLLALKAEVDRQYPGVYEYMRRLQRGGEA